jgi:hypothetical protein
MEKLPEHKVNKQRYSYRGKKHQLLIPALQPVHNAGNQNHSRSIKTNQMDQSAK